MAVVDICLAMILTTEKTPPMLKKEEVKVESTNRTCFGRN
jgi:hypothetical protein